MNRTSLLLSCFLLSSCGGDFKILDDDDDDNNGDTDNQHAEDDSGLDTDDTDDGGNGGGGSQDSDGDGLTDAEENTLGTDPNDSDSDGDDWEDGDEMDEGTDPNNSYSHPYEGGYSVGGCDEEPAATGPTGSGDYGNVYQKGDIVENFSLRDQYDEMVDLYSFCGQNIMIAFGAFW